MTSLACHADATQRLEFGLDGVLFAKLFLQKDDAHMRIRESEIK